jgi:predicted MFS family arabinose efflux permease
MSEPLRYLLLLTLAAASRFLVLADFTIADLIAPDLQTSFHTTPTALLLARNAMPISLAIGIPLAVLLVEKAGLAKTYLAALVCFTAALLISANATSLDMFVLGRIVQGLSTAVVSSQVFAVLWVFAPSRLLNQGVALVAGVGGVGMAAGPVLASLGGTGGQWRTIFIVLALAVSLLIPLAWLSLRRPIQAVSRIPEAGSYWGGSLFCGAWALLLTRWPDGSPLDSAWMRGTEVLLLIGLGLWLRNRRQGEDGPWRSSQFRAGFLVRFALFGAIATPSFFLVLYLRNQLGWSMEQAALMGVAMSAPMILSIPLSARLLRQISLTRLTSLCLQLMTAGLLGWVLALAFQLVGLMLLCNGLVGISIGLLIPAITSKAMQAGGSRFALQASGWLVLAEALGPMLGLASQSSLLLFVTRLFWRHAMAEAKLPYDLMASDLNRVQQALPLPNAVDQTIASQAFLHGLQSIYLCSALILLATAFACKKLLQPAK